MVDFVKSIPSELSIKLFSSLNTPSLSYCMQVSSHWRLLVQNSDEIWKRVCNRDFYIELNRLNSLQMNVSSAVKGWRAICKMCIESQTYMPSERLDLNAALMALFHNTTRSMSISEVITYDAGKIMSASISAALEMNYSLTSLNVSNCKLGDVGIVKISRALRNRNTRLKSLTVYENEIGEEGADCLASLIEEMGWPYELDVSGNAITETGVNVLLKAVATSPDFRRLDVSENAIDSREDALVEGFAHIQKADGLLSLKMNDMGIADTHIANPEFIHVAESKLVSLSLKNNFITSQGAKIIAQLLEKLAEGGGNLQILDIGGNWIGNEGINAILSVLFSLDGESFQNSEVAGDMSKITICKKMQLLYNVKFCDKMISRGNLLIITEANAFYGT